MKDMIKFLHLFFGLLGVMGQHAQSKRHVRFFFWVLQGDVGLIAELWKCHAGGTKNRRVCFCEVLVIFLLFLQVRRRGFCCANILNSGYPAGAVRLAVFFGYIRFGSQFVANVSWQRMI